MDDDMVLLRKLHNHNYMWDSESVECLTTPEETVTLRNRGRPRLRRTKCLSWFGM